MSLYEVSGVIINIANDTSEALKYMNEFPRIRPAEQQREADLNFNLRFKDSIEVPKGNLISGDNIGFKWIKKTSDQRGYCIYVQIYGIDKIMVLMDITPDWRDVTITCSEYTGDILYEKINYRYLIGLYTHLMMGMVFRYNLLQSNGLVVHASTIKWDGKGLMFSAPSGTGKSTHVKLWQKCVPDVSVLNDDTPAVRINNGLPYVFGTPWSGSAFIHSNDSAPLFAIVLLEQAQENMIRKLDFQEAISKLMPRVFLPYFDQHLMDKALGIFEKIIASVPVYLLKCRPDGDAVELVYQCLK